MELVAVAGLPRLHVTPLAVVHADTQRVVIELDDEHEARGRLVFEPYQAVRITTADCFVLDDLSILAQTVAEVVDSPWLRVLRAAQLRVDARATFMKAARHFLVPAQDDFIEVVAWNVRWEVMVGGPADQRRR